MEDPVSCVFVLLLNFVVLLLLVWSAKTLLEAIF